MAVAFQGFSIREYAAKMRTVDVGKCWPFGIDPADEMKKEDIKLSLPPITVTKFRWWSNELQGRRKHDQIHGGNANVRGEEVELRRNGSELDAERAEFKKSQAEDEKLEMVCPVCLVFTAATVNAVNAHMDSCLAQSSQKEARRQMKAKTSKAPKKRSIAEIFAVAPQIEAVDVDDESGDEDSSGGGEMFGSCKFSSRDNVVSIIKGKKNINKRLNLSFSGCGQYNQEQDQNADGRVHPEKYPDKMILNSTQPTMRLMGKDLAVGRSSKFEDGKVWTDKEIIAEDCPTSTVLENSFMERNFLQDWMLHPASRKPKDSVANSLAIQCNHTVQDNLMTKASESRISNPFLNWQTNAAHHNGSLNFNENPSNSHSFVHSPASSGVFRGAPSFREPFPSGAEALRGSHYSPLASTPHISCQHIPWSPVAFNHKQNLPHATKSAFNFPFLYTDCREDVQPYGFQRSSQGLPPWLLHAQQDKQLITSSQIISDLGHNYPPQIISGSNFFPSQPLNHLSEVSYPVKSQSQSKSSLGSTSIFHPALVPVIPAVNTPAVNMEYGNRIKFRDKLKSKAFGIKDPNPCKKTKRPTAKADCSTKATRIPNLQLQKDLNAVMGLTSENIGRDLQSNVAVAECNPSRDKASSLGCGSNESSKDGLRNSTGIDFSKDHNLARSGPVKLTAGAKHILKPSQAADQDNSRLIHSTLPFAVAANCESAQESQKKLTKIYRF
ncbi:hypothetical protein I3760_03G181200 [Carya illinoinensis]|nr:hypothetical protein I3760_03G181200 [Carya illinoinensis]